MASYLSYRNVLLSNSTVIASTLNAGSVSYSTLTGSTMSTRGLTVSTLTGSTINGTTVFFSTMTASTILTAGSTISLARNVNVPNRFVEVGCDLADSMYLDFHSKDSALPDYSTRIISQGGTTTGTGNLNMYASTIGMMCSAGVGIGTTAPLNNFEVYNNGGVGGTTQANITSWAGGATTTNTAALNLRIQGAGGGSVDNIICGQYNPSGVGNYNIAFKPGGATTAMTVVGNGNVGIGVTLPTTILSVQEVPVAGNVSRKNMFLGLRNGTYSVQNGVSMAFALGPNVTTISPYGALDIKLNGFPGAGNDYGLIPDITVMSIIGNGNVGIGTTSPSAPLHVYSSGGVSLATTGTVNYTNSSILGFGFGGGSYGTRDSFRIISQVVNRDNGAGPFFDYGAQADLVFQRKTNNLYASAANDITYTEVMRISGTTGNVGIKKAAPSGALDITGIVYVNNGVAATTPGYYQGLEMSYVGIGSTGYASIIASNPGSTYTSISLNPSGGNVGIGITNPNATLHVNGGIRGVNGVYSYATTFYYYAGNADWNTQSIFGDPSAWPWGGNTFLVTLRGPPSLAGNAVRASFIVFHSRWSAGNDNYGQVTALSNAWVSGWGITDYALRFTFNSSQAQVVNINILVLN